MSDIAKLQIGNNSYEFPLVKGTENEVAINIKTLRSATNGVITIDPGFKNTGSCQINLQSESAQIMIAEKIEKALQENINETIENVCCGAKFRE